MKHTREEITEHVEKHILQYDDTGKVFSVGWYGNLYIAESKLELINLICRKEGVK